MILGTAVNASAIVAGGAIGLLIAKAGKKKQTNGNMAESVQKILGLATAVLGIQMVFEPHSFLPVLICLSIGTCIGEYIDIEEKVDRFGSFLKKITKSKEDNFVNGFVSASILYCVGATAILGALRDGFLNDPSLLYVKSLLDGVFSIIFAGTLGVGVLFSAIPILIYQGAISLGARQLSFILNNDIYINGISVTGGILVIGVGLNIAGITKLRIGNMLPSLLLIPIYDYIAINMF